MTVYLSGQVVSDDTAALYRRWGYSGVCCPNDVRAGIADCPEGEELVLAMNSPGGSVYAGFEMYSLIRKFKGAVRAEVLGIAASAMSVVAAACDTVCMYPVSQIMIHRARTIADGTSREMQEARQMLDSIDESILNAYEAKCGEKSSREALARMMRKETFLTAQEAIACGLADELITEETTDLSLAVASNEKTPHVLALPPIEDLLRREAEQGNNKPEETEERRSEAKMEIESLEQLEEQFPELCGELEARAAERERTRIAEIDALSLPGFEDQISAAKADPEQNAGTVAQMIVRAQKERAKAHLTESAADAEEAGANTVTAAAAPEKEDGENMDAMAKAAVAAWKEAK